MQNNCRILSSLIAFLSLLTVSGPLLLGQTLPSAGLFPEELTNRRLGLEGDASSTAWNPAVLGMTDEIDAVLGIRYDTNFTLKSMNYGLFTKLWYLGAGTTGLTGSGTSSVQRYYAGLGFPLDFISEELPLTFGIGAGWGDGQNVLDEGEINTGVTARPMDDLVAGFSVNDLLGRNGDARARLDVLFSPFNWLGLRGSVGYDSRMAVGELSEVSPELGIDLSLFGRTVDVSGTYNFNTQGLRLGVEMLFGDEYILGSFNDFSDEFSFQQGVLIGRYRPDGNETPFSRDDIAYAPTPGARKGWAPDRAYTPVGIAYKYSVSDANYDPLALVRPCNFTPSGFDTPETLFESVRTGGGSYRRLTERLREISTGPANLYKDIRKEFYSRHVRSSELMSDDSLTIRSRQGYSIGVQNVDNSQFPIVSVYMQVTDDEGRSVRGLGMDDFTFVDSTLKIISVRPIDSTRRIPVDVTLIIDCSGSMGDEIQAVRTNAQSFVDRMEASGADYRIGGVLYGSIIYDTLHPTADFNRFRDFVSNAAAIGGDEISSLAVQAATEMNYRPDAQRIFVLITDDWVIQQNAELTEADLVEMLWDTKARLYTIGNQCKNNAAVTTRLTLGQEYDIRNPFNSILDEIGTDITTTYDLVYESRLPELPKVTILRGRVRDETGRPAGVGIGLAESQNSSVLMIQTNATTGEYEVEIVEGKKYSAEIKADPYLPVSQVVDLTLTKKGDTVVKDFTLYLPQTTLRGQILDEKNRGVAGKVQVEDAETLETVMMLETDENGRYRTIIDVGRRYRLTPIVSNYIPTPEELDLEGVAKGANLEKNLHVISIEEAIATGATFRLNNIFFDYDKADLKPESIPELNKVVSLMNDYPVIKVEIGAHTDARGSDDYNQGLSERRAQSVVNWLIGQGINDQRLFPKGYGETKPVADNETDEGRALNRRVEFKLVK